MRIGTDRSRQARHLASLLASAAVAAMVAGCQTASQAPVHTGSIANSAVVVPSDLSSEEALGAVRTWGAAYTRDEKDKAAALNYAAALRAAGETGQGVAVMRKAAIYHPTDREVLAAFGKALAADGKFREALATVQRAQHSDNPDWQLLATEGAILDSMAQHDEARARYRQALVLAPNDPQVLNNLGLSYLLTNELAEAEKALRKAAENPKATLKIRQNLALVLRLRGKDGEANGVPGGSDMPEAIGEAGGQENTWKALAEL